MNNFSKVNLSYEFLKLAPQRVSSINQFVKTMSVKLTSLDVICISRQLAIISSEHKGIVLH
jgi:hypothetical protein